MKIKIYKQYPLGWRFVMDCPSVDIAKAVAAELQTLSGIIYNVITY